MIKRWMWALAMAAIVTPAVMTFAGGGGGGGGFGGGGGGFAGGGGGGGGAGGFSITGFVRMNVTFTDDEWKVVEPKLQKIIDTATVANTGARGGFGGRGGGGAGGGAGGGTPNAVQTALTALNEALAATPATPDDQLKTKVAALREARKKARADLETAREDLKKVLTIRQEAALVANYGQWIE